VRGKRSTRVPLVIAAIGAILLLAPAGSAAPAASRHAKSDRRSSALSQAHSPRLVDTASALSSLASAPGLLGSRAGRAGRCLLAGRVLVEIDDGLRHGYSILWPVYAVRSRDYTHVYMVSARVAAAPTARVTPKTIVATATWATNRLDGTGLLYSVDHVAAAVSDWGHLPHSSLNDDGVEASRACAHRPG
jgi:hypothetical protein